MIENDTIKLLRECNAGVKMGVSAIDEVLPKTKSARLKEILTDGKSIHQRLGNETREFLNSYSDSGKDPGVAARSMSWMKTNAMLAMDKSDETVADLITDGCDMGVKSLSRYLNQYAAADESSKNIAKRLIAVEAQMSVDMRSFL